MKIAFHGAARTVTGSKHLLTLDNGKKILFDCGLFQGMGKETDVLNSSFGFDASEVDYLLLSHAHIDHCGLIPKLVKEGFRGKIFCTAASKDLAEILLLDSADIQRDDAKFINKKRAKQHLPPIEPLYTEADVALALPLFTAVDYGKWIEIESGLEVLYTDAGHIIGSAAVHLRVTTGKETTQISFSGDVGRYRDVILRSPEVFPQADYIIIESTYGSSLHEDVFNTPEQLLDWINKTCVEKRGKLIIPAFSVGRTQEILYFLNQLGLEKRLPAVPVYVDSPLSREATEVVKSHPETFNSRIQKILKVDDDPFDFPGLTFIKTVDESKALNEKQEPCIIISASGMADAGRIKHHIMNNIGDHKNTILLVGYCEPHSLGGHLMAGDKEVRIFGDFYPVKAEVGTMRSMSAHGDYDDLCQFLACQHPREVKKLFIVHGEYDVQTEFQSRLMKKGFKDVEVPAQHEVFGLDS
ncbi:metallo-beta-lactamase family protein [Filimonas lacunae]|uniref:Metallo-beta-lactamase family protein n=1 Tax=Filimonas lacunae TaxID=477680 RepID=A0A173M9K1_9BACT|nr:MBL fold metallo-hydrolase [Filimonas lacunae]BAV04224.1 metallo-beta-lactamase family protein, RNA-specific [Filimonas lacunae]SIT13968.1 metallo-beta-lactamase family protein [Filimonas lacunae]